MPEMDGHEALCLCTDCKDPEPRRPEHVVKAEALREAADAFRADQTLHRMPVTALEVMANELDPPVPPRPTEPTGDKAVVRDRDGDVWVRWPQGWLCNDAATSTQRDWAFLVDHYGPVTVLSDGVAD